jgi:hypothetical protein
VKLGFRQGFDPTLLSWGGPDEPAAEECSICDAPLGNDEEPDYQIPLIIWREDGWCVRLCDTCTQRWIRVVQE